MLPQSLELTFGSASNNDFEKIGHLKQMHSKELQNSGVSIGFECLDRFIFDPGKCYDKLAAIGVKWARCQTGWCRCEKEKGIYDFKWLDEVVDNLLERGVEPWFNLGYGNKLYMPDAYGDAAVGCVPLYYGEETLDAWKNFVAALAKHFSCRVKFWEIWNEPDCKEFWQPSNPSPLEYARFIKITAPIIKEYIPDARIGACTACVFKASYTKDFICSGIANYIDVFSVHAYRLQPEQNNYLNAIKTIRRLWDMNEGSHIKIHQGEAGYASSFPENHWMSPYILDSEENQAKWLLRRFVTDFSAGVEMSSFFQMVDMIKKYQVGFCDIKPALHGILDGKNYEPKKSYYALAHVSTLFDCDTNSCPAYVNINCDVDIPKKKQVSKLFNVSFVCRTFMRNNRPMYFYYLPEDIQLGWSGLSNLEISLLPGEYGTGISTPVIVDMLEGSVYRIQDFQTAGEYVSQISGLPIKDYPLLLTDIHALDGRVI